MNSLTIIDNKSVNLWESEENLAEIKQIFAPKLTQIEFKIFVEMGKATGLNPFLKEIWAVKYDGMPAQIFVGRDGYRKSAQRNPHYDFHLADAVYSNDKFEVKNGEVNHTYNLQERGHLLGAYCIVKRKTSSRPSYVYVELKEYSTGKSTWGQKPATMIKKVAEAQALKSAFQELFAGTYHEFEQFETEANQNAKPAGKGVNGLKERLGIQNETIVEDVQVERGEVAEKEIEEEIVTHDDDDMPFITVIDVKAKINGAKNLEELKKVKGINISLTDDEKKEINALYVQKSKTLKVA